MPEDFDEGAPRKKKKRKGFGRRRIALIIIILVIFSLGATFQHYYVEPVIGSSLASNYAICLGQKQVLDARFVDCTRQLQDANNLFRDCEYQLDQCTGT